jgi:hypothetical protein
MTQNKDLKSEIRARMRETNEKYTEARRAVLAEREGLADVLTEIGKTIKPGRVTAVLSGGGETNFRLALPAIGTLLAAGHPLVHTTGGRDGVLALPNDFDFAIELGVATEAEVVDGLAGGDDGFDTLLAKMEPMMRGITTMDGRASFPELADLLARCGADGQPAVLWVQDFDDGGPVAVGRPKDTYRAELEEQMPELRRLADETGAAIVLGHLDDDLGDRSDWWPIAQHADTTFVSAHDWDDPTTKNTWLVFDRTLERGIVRGAAPVEQWRSKYVELSRQV